MKILNLILLFISIFVFSNIYGQDEIEKYGCMFLKSKMTERQYTKDELKYAQNLEFRSDTFDILNYRIKITATEFSSKILTGQCDIDFLPKMKDLNYIVFDLLNFNVDSIFSETKISGYNYESPFLRIEFEEDLDLNDTIKVKIFYHGKSTIDPSGFGGFYFENSYAFNLGIGLQSIPHNYGRAWFPCFDNFVERSTYDFDIITNSNHFAYCTGDYLGVDTLPDSKKIFHYRMSEPITTYQAGVAVSDYREINWNFEGISKNIPIQLVCKPGDTTKVKSSFAFLPFAIEALESWYGPYMWNRVGYALTTNGAMEHPTNIAFPDFLGADGDPEVTMDIMAHELAHHWWGDGTTLTTAYDMWIKEGTSEYGMHQFIEYFYGKERFRELMKKNSYDVISTAHIKDDGYRALSGMPMDHTYGPTTYNKGAMVIHNLRTYMGDSLFKVGMQSILKNYAFSDINAEEFENQLEVSTGFDLSCFFNDWIYAPGFNAFEIDSVSGAFNDDKYIVNTFIEQKLYHAPHYHCNVPIIISYYDENCQRHDFKHYFSGQYGVFVDSINFKPIFTTLNEDQFLNNSQLGETLYFFPNTSYSLIDEKITIKTNEMSVDSFLMRVEHIWGSPDTMHFIDGNQNIELSDQHYWVITGNLPENNQITVTFPYLGFNTNDIDFSISHTNEDSVYIVFRPNAKVDWQIPPDFIRQKFAPTDGRGSIIINNLQQGQYALAKISSISSATNQQNIETVNIFPNPANERVYIDVSGIESTDVIIYNSMGKTFQLDNKYDGKTLEINISKLNPGVYFISNFESKKAYKIIGKIVIE